MSSREASRDVKTVFQRVVEDVQKHGQNTNDLNCYQPQRSCGQGHIFTPVGQSVRRGGWGCLPQCMLGYHTPQEQTPPRADTPWADTPPQADTPWSRQPLRTRHPPSETRSHQEQTPPGSRHPPGADTPSPHSRHPLSDTTQDLTPSRTKYTPWD